MSSHSADSSGGAGHGSDGHDHHDGSMMDHAKPYLTVGAVLLVFTAITVALSYWDFHSTAINVTVAMVVATFKVCLVGAIFMHLKGEKKTIWRPLWFTMFFVLGLFLLSLLHFYDPIFSTVNAHH